MNEKELVNLAIKASKNSFSPYSKFKVGAALLCTDGSVYLGCNIENVSFGATNCAERTAVFSAVADGKKDFSMMAVVGSYDGNFTEYTLPCGICRQVLNEFCKDDFNVILYNGRKIKTVNMTKLLPLPFKSFLKEGL